MRSPGRTTRVASGSTGGLRTVRTTSSARSPRYSSSMPSRPTFSYVRARSGFLKTEPTTGSCPPGRKSFAVSGKSANLAWLPSVCERNVESTTKPSRARRSAGFSSLPSDLLPQASRAVPQVAGVPGRAHAQTAGDGVREGERLPVLQEERGVRAARGGLAAVDGLHGVLLGVVVDEVAAPADARRVRLGHAERGRGRHGGVDGVAALAEHLDPGGRRVRVDAGDRAAVSHRDGGLGRWHGRWRRRGRCGRADRDNSGEHT